MHVTLINPNICMQKGDFFGTGIPYMPMSLAWIAGFLRSKGHSITVVDAFGENPFIFRKEGDLIVQGLTVQQILEKIPSNVECIGVYAAKVVADTITKKIVKSLREKFSVPIVLLENTQSVVAYSLKVAGKEFLNLGVDYIILGEGEYRFQKLLECIKNNVTPDFDGLYYKKGNDFVLFDKKEFITNLDELPFPAWDLFPLENYWKLGYAHGPMQSRYIPLLTSRGCPYGCKYCVVPETNARRWRFRNAKNVVDEMEHWNKKFGVVEFHWEDLNPTIRKDRMLDISKEIIDRGLHFRWKLVAGTKVETMDVNVITQMAKAGCTYISVSPESGSPNVLKLMDKPFNHELGLELVQHMKKEGITTQACFVLGFPGETKEDLNMTKTYIRKLVRAGIDEVALFIMTPIPGSNKFESVQGYKNFSQLTFSPVWRADYKYLSGFRTKRYIEFYLLKLFYHPLRLLQQPWNLFTHNFKTKTEMTAYRTWRLFILQHVKQVR